MTGGVGSDVPQVQLFRRGWYISRIWSNTKSIRVQIFLVGVVMVTFWYFIHFSKSTRLFCPWPIPKYPSPPVVPGTVWDIESFIQNWSQTIHCMYIKKNNFFHFWCVKYIHESTVRIWLIDGCWKLALPVVCLNNLRNQL